jgi:Protein of unknown function (DUF3060)
MKHVLSAALFTFGLTALAATTAAAEVTIMDNHRSTTINCAHQREVNVIGNHNKVTLTGTCSALTVTGNHNTVFGSTTEAGVAGTHNTIELEAVDEIAVTGTHNTISYKQPIARKRTAVSNTGTNNKITQRK